MIRYSGGCVCLCTCSVGTVQRCTDHEKSALQCTNNRASVLITFLFTRSFKKLTRVLEFLVEFLVKFCGHLRFIVIIFHLRMNPNRITSQLALIFEYQWQPSLLFVPVDWPFVSFRFLLNFGHFAMLCVFFGSCVQSLVICGVWQ